MILVIAIAVGRGKNYGVTLLPKIKEAIAKTKNTRNNILAIPTAEPAIPPNPSTAAIIATTKNVIAQFSIMTSLLISRTEGRKIFITVLL
jgi:hypothetical protein